MAAEVRIERQPDDRVDGLEGWIRRTDEPELRGIEAVRLDDDEWPWVVVVSAAEFIREEPLETEMRDSMIRTLSRVSGVAAVAEEDREVWIVAGSPSGEELVRAASTVVDSLYDRAITVHGSLRRGTGGGAESASRTEA